MITEFGKLLRIIRINTGDSARTMAEKFGMSPSYLSTIENGKRNIPPEMEELVIRAYDLSEHDKEKLRKTIIDTTAQLKVDLTEMEEKTKKVIFSLTKGNIDEETLNQLCEIIDKSRGTKK